MEPNQIDFGSVKYKERHTSSLFVVNTGEVSAMFGFIPPPDPAFAQHASPLPHWISAKPVAGEVAPGEKVEISLTIHVTGGMWGDANELAGILIKASISSNKTYPLVLPACCMKPYRMYWFVGLSKTSPWLHSAEITI